MKPTAQITDIDRLFRACADPTRLRILCLLRRGELCVCDLVSVLAVPQPTASRHLAYLRKAGLVLTRKDGLWIYYRLAPAESQFHRKLVECLGCCFEDVPALQADAAKAARLRPSGGCCPTKLNE